MRVRGGTVIVRPPVLPPTPATTRRGVRPGLGGWRLFGGLASVCVRRTIEGHLVVLIVVDVAHVPEDEEEEQSDAIGCTGLSAEHTPV